jgi:hypothetical protein
LIPFHVRGFGGLSASASHPEDRSWLTQGLHDQKPRDQPRFGSRLFDLSAHTMKFVL